MPSEQETVCRSQTLAAAGGTATNGSHPAVARPARPAAALPAEADRLELRVSFPRQGEYHEENSRLLPLPANRWERLAIPLPADWQGGGLRLDPRCRFGLMEIVGIRIISGVMGESLWEMLGRDLLGGVRVSAGMQVLSNQLRLRLLCTGEDAQIVLPDLVLPSAEVPLVLELGLRVRTDLASIGYTLHEWVDDAGTQLRESQAHLAAAEAARTYSEGWAKSLLTEVDVARTDGDRREAALQQQLADAHEAARRHAATLRAEIDAARTDGRQQVAALNAQLAAAQEAAQAHAATLTAEITVVREDGTRREAALQQQLADAHEAARWHAATLLTEIDAARTDGRQQVAALNAQLAAAQEAAQAHAATLTAEIAVVREDGARREAALQEQLADAHEAARRHAATLRAEIDAARTDGNQREAAFQAQLAAAHEAARALAATLTTEVESARAHGDERAAALMTTIHEAHLQIEQGRKQLHELSANAALLQRELTEQRNEAHRLSEEHRGRVRSMQRSLSWRLTLPLRMIGRALTGRRPASRKDAA